MKSILALNKFWLLLSLIKERIKIKWFQFNFDWLNNETFENANFASGVCLQVDF